MCAHINTPSCLCALPRAAAATSAATARTVMQIDNPRLCTFWLEAVVHGLPRASALELRLPLTVLQAWLWFYTFAAVPAWLRRTLVLNLRRVTAQLFTRARPPHWAACPFADLLRHRLGSAGEWECVRDRKHVRPGCAVPSCRHSLLACTRDAICCAAACSFEEG